MTFVTLKIHKIVISIICIVAFITVAVIAGLLFFPKPQPEPELPVETPVPTKTPPPTPSPTPTKYIKWVDFTVPYSVLEDTLDVDIASQEEEVQIGWVDLLAYLGAKYGGDFSRYKQKDLVSIVERLKSGETMEEIAGKMKYFAYYQEAYSAILGEFVGAYSVKTEAGWLDKYGLKVYSPIAEGYGFSHFDDFGASRSYGYKRKHLGHDMMGNVGTPVIAVESGIVECLGWNQYGGWRIGIRSFDKKRYYYYAHLRKNHPYNIQLKEGDIVRAGDVIGYLGMTGYSTKENVNNIETPHLHFGLQLIFDESQKDGTNQIWVDLYDIVLLLQKHKSTVYKNEEEKEYYRQYDFTEPLLERNGYHVSGSETKTPDSGSTGD